MERKTLFAEVLLPLPLPGTFTYRVPFDMNDILQAGMRVVVQFGRKKLYTGLAKSIHETIPTDFQPKYLLAILDEKPIVDDLHLRFWEWISAYYLCYPGDVMQAALPSALKLASETRVVINPEFSGDFSSLNEREYLIAEALTLQETLTLTEVSEIVHLGKVIPLIKTLIEKGVILVDEELNEKYRPKTETYIELEAAWCSDDQLREAFCQLEKKAFKQLEVLMTFIRLSGHPSEQPNLVKKTKLLKEAKATSGQVSALIKKGILRSVNKVVSRLQSFDQTTSPDTIQLSEAQQTAWDTLQETMAEKPVTLLHGVTGSGKTELYIKLIADTLAQGKQVLYLLPEIALTTQIINRLRKYFGNRVGVYHSRYNELERVEIWNKVQASENRYQILLGARSALFLPYTNLGLVIVDEEHDASYKQYDPAPRYQARDAAIYLASMHKAKTLLGTATPSLESYYNARSGKFGLVELKKRFGGLQMPEILIADLKKESKQRSMKSHFSSFLMEHIQASLDNGEQIILFQNRRGFSLRLECDICNWTPQCKNCDVSLIYHKHNNRLRCHYCGYSIPVPKTCPDCGHPKITMKGFGTEKIEEELAIYFPGKNIIRMDLDTTRSKNAYQKIIGDFEEKRIDILVGTQMVTKGLDFDNVGLVGVLNADNMISFPDFRSFERSFQLLSQVSGRAGRKKRQGKVIIQSYNPYHAVIRDVIDNNFLSMYKSQILERKNFHYPPFYRLIRIHLKHRDPETLNQAASKLALNLRRKFGKRVLGPEYPMVSRIKNLYIKDLLIKLDRNAQLPAAKENLIKILNRFATQDGHKSIRLVIDVDPL